MFNHEVHEGKKEIHVVGELMRDSSCINSLTIVLTLCSQCSLW